VIVPPPGLLLVAAIRHPHLVKRVHRGRRAIGRLLGGVAVLLLVVVAHRYAFGLGSIAYAMYGPFIVAYLKLRHPRVGGETISSSGPSASPAPLPPSPAPR
jgi:hypothetical protein